MQVIQRNTVECVTASALDLVLMFKLGRAFLISQSVPWVARGLLKKKKAAASVSEGKQKQVKEPKGRGGI